MDASTPRLKVVNLRQRKDELSSYRLKIVSEDYKEACLQWWVLSLNTWIQRGEPKYGEHRQPNRSDCCEFIPYWGWWRRRWFTGYALLHGRAADSWVAGCGCAIRQDGNRRSLSSALRDEIMDVPVNFESTCSSKRYLKVWFDGTVPVDVIPMEYMPEHATMFVEELPTYRENGPFRWKAGRTDFWKIQRPHVVKNWSRFPR